MTPDHNLFKVDNSDTNLQTGKILIAEPFSRSEYFKKAIVLLTEHGPNGTVGFILNKFVSFRMHDLMYNFPEFDVPVSIGGPVRADSVHFLHTVGDMIPNNQHVIGNIYWGGDIEIAKILISEKLIQPNQIRFFMGYSGWDIGQLENEIQDEHWILSQTSEKNIMETGENIWEDVLSNWGEKYRFWKNVPIDPIYN
jgi:putative transcriptional regulator